MLRIPNKTYPGFTSINTEINLNPNRKNKGLIPLPPDFIDHFTSLRNKYLLKTEALFSANKQQWLTTFANHFQSTCVKIVNLQNESNLPPLSCLEYTMLYTNFINRNHKAEIWAYNEEWYLDDNQQQLGEYDPSVLFTYFNDLWNTLISEQKKYLGLVKPQDIKSLMLYVLPDFYSYLIKIARQAIKDLTDKQPFTDIIKNELFRINVGDYMNRTEPIYTEKKTKNATELANWFNDQTPEEYIFGDYTNLDFSGKHFPKTDFRYAQFNNSNLTATILTDSSLIGANFSHANMKNINLENSLIYEADFSHANLINANFTNAYAKAGLSDTQIWQAPGFLPASFHHADLTNANFSGADLTGADFTGAKLCGTNFTDTVLDDAIFDDMLQR